MKINLYKTIIAYRKKRPVCDTGFTVIELLIAMAIFSSLLTLSVIGFIQINQIYQQGLATQRTQEEARRVLEGIVRDGRQSASIQVAGPGLPVGTLCIGNHIYFVDDNRLYKQNRNSDDPCLPGSIAGSERLTPTDLEVSRFQLSPWEGPDGSGGYRSTQVTIRIATAGTDDLMDGDECDPRVAGVEFCSTSELSSIFTTRGAFSTGGDE